MKFLSIKVLRESGKRRLFMIPNFFTLANAFFGFLAVIKTFEYQFVTAAYLILFAVLMDFIDGRLARALNSSSSIGMELDSLSDAISFGFAPAVLLYAWYLSDIGFIGVVVLSVYLCAGLLRLARFNVLSLQKESRNFFIGLPIPSAALFLVFLVINNRWIISSPLRFLLHPIGILVVITLLAFLMVSPIHFPSFKKIELSRAMVFVLIFGLSVFLALFLTKGFSVPFLGLLFYIFWGMISYVISFFRKLFYY